MARQHTRADPSPQVWAQAVREHQKCIEEWAERERHDPGIAFTMHGADLHVPKESS